jgi:hypothetical protein|tara:strand:+ start:2243 stop:2620 length:378 start_codon:yes stop_codon:yes gene_type:complete
MKYNSDFKYDLKIGNDGERIVDEIFSNKKLEVKRDSWVGRSGNIAIEFKSRNKPSGIVTTQADYWVFIFSREYKDKVILIVETQRLKEVAREYAKLGSIKEMGDDNTSMAVLIPIKEISKFAVYD